MHWVVCKSMSTFKLAKRLKDAGFPQVGYGYTFSDGKNSEHCVFPSLTKLIDECGINFGSLSRTAPGEWYAVANFEPVIGNGSTPEEAVAHLWLRFQNNGKA